MPVNFSKWVSIGGKIVGYLPTIISSVEALKFAFKGPGEKKSAAVEAAKSFLELTEDVADKDLANDPKVLEAIGAAVDALVNVQNVIAAVKASKPVKPQPPQ